MHEPGRTERRLLIARCASMSKQIQRLGLREDGFPPSEVGGQRFCPWAARFSAAARRWARAFCPASGAVRGDKGCALGKSPWSAAWRTWPWRIAPGGCRNASGDRIYLGRGSNLTLVTRRYHDNTRADWSGWSGGWKRTRRCAPGHCRHAEIRNSTMEG